eukprot:TRINITY_DN25460_c0_g1_i1.p1 TRINITY_DN25460_c0_g1~~TRINITY_DN25460_c0_g1_i1.p1  ORF type:complete len:448 (-),score=119.81 TRINITY_DN25460_c0_g1_i1:304-1518(-)
MVDKLILKDKNVVGVAYVKNGKAIEARLKSDATSRVFLAAGPFETPAILMRSGVGKKSELDALKIPVVTDVEKMGTFVDRHSVPVQVAAMPTETAARTPTGSKSANFLSLPDVRTSGKNFYEATGFGVNCWLDAFLMGSYNASLRSKLCSDFLIFGMNFIGDNGRALRSSTFGVQAMPSKPSFSGRVTISSTNASADLSVAITFDETTVPTLNEGLQKALDIMSDAALSKVRAPHKEATQISELATNFGHAKASCGTSQLVDLCVANITKCLDHPNVLPVPNETAAPDFYKTYKDYQGPAWHATGGASSAIDANFKVKGLERAFVIDSSAASTLPPVSPQAAFMVMGYYLADLNSVVAQTTTTTSKPGSAGNKSSTEASGASSLLVPSKLFFEFLFVIYASSFF